MGYFKNIINPFTGQLQKIFNGSLVNFKEGVATSGDLPSTGNVEGDGRIANDDGHLYIWDGDTWQDQGDVVDIKWASIENKPSSTVENIDDAVDKKHSALTSIEDLPDVDFDTGTPTDGQVLTYDSASGKWKAETLPVHNSLSGLNDGDYKHLTATEKIDTDDAISKKHTQNTDTGTSNNFDVAGEISIKLYSQTDEPILGQDNRMAIWIDTDDSNRVYLLYRRGVGDQVAVELA